VQQTRSKSNESLGKLTKLIDSAAAPARPEPGRAGQWQRRTEAPVTIG
jgi:hypothetical protein